MSGAHQHIFLPLYVFQPYLHGLMAPKPVWILPHYAWWFNQGVEIYGYYPAHVCFQPCYQDSSRICSPCLMIRSFTFTITRFSWAWQLNNCSSVVFVCIGSKPKNSSKNSSVLLGGLYSLELFRFWTTLFILSSSLLLPALQRPRHILPHPEPTAQQRLPFPRVRCQAVPGCSWAEWPLQPHGDPLPAAQRRGGQQRGSQPGVQGPHGVHPVQAEPDRRAVRVPPPDGFCRHRYSHRFCHPVFCH